MRISETVVVQLIESEPPRLVVVDDQVGTEILLDRADVLELLLQISTGEAPDEGITLLSDDSKEQIRIPSGDLLRLTHAFDYFLPHL